MAHVSDAALAEQGGIRRMMAKIRVVEGAITKAAEAIGVFLLVCMVIVVTIGVFTRYVLSDPVPWSEEAARYMLVWTAFLGAGVGVRKGSHFGILMLLNKFPAALRHLLVLAIGIGIGFFALILIRIGVNLMMMASVQTSPALGLSMQWVYLAIPVSGTLILFYLLLDMIDLLTIGQAVLCTDTTAHLEEE